MTAALGSGAVGALLVACLAGWATLSGPEAPEGVEFAAVLLIGVLGAVAGHALTRWRPTAVGVVVPAGVAAAFVAGLPGSLDTTATAPPLGYANANAALLVIATAATLLAAGHVAARTRPWWIAVALVLTAATFGTGSRAGLVSCVLVLLLWRKLHALGAVGWRWFSAAVLVAAVGVTVLLGATGSDSERSQRAERTDPTLVGNTLGGTRAALWADALDMVRSEPMLGHGAGSFAEESEIAADPDLAWAHSEPLQVAAELGLVGAGLAAALAGWVLAAAGRAAPLIAVLLLQTTVDYVFHFPWVVLSFGMVLGAAATVGTGTPGFTPPATRMPPGWTDRHAA